MSKKNNVVMLKDADFPSNEKTAKKVEPKKEVVDKKIEQVTTGKVIQKKKSIWGKFKSTFRKDEAEPIGQFILWDLAVPATKKFLSEAVNIAMDMVLYGEAKGPRLSRDRGITHVRGTNYNRQSTIGRRGYLEPIEPPVYTANRAAMHNFDDIILDNRGDAELVLHHLIDLIDEYGVASVADLYDLVGITANFTDNNYGWVNLSRATVDRVRGGYLIRFPRTEVLD